MNAGLQSVQRYKAKAARRPILFWWQAFFLLAVMAFLWNQLPLTAVLFEARVIPSLPVAHAAYVVLDSKYASAAFKKSLTAWTSGGTGGKLAPGMEIGGIDFVNAPHPAEYLERGGRYPGVWQPLAVSPLPVRLPDVAAPSDFSAMEGQKVKAPLQGVRIELDRALKGAAFAFPIADSSLTERAGHCRFFVETEKDGTVAHVLLLTARTPGAAAFELLLLRGHATGAARGSLDIHWTFPKP